MSERPGLDLDCPSSGTKRTLHTIERSILYKITRSKPLRRPRGPLNRFKFNYPSVNGFSFFFFGKKKKKEGGKPQEEGTFPR